MGTPVYDGNIMAFSGPWIERPIKIDLDREIDVMRTASDLLS